jgi:hypothetical protein
VADYKILITLRPDNILTLTTPNQKVYELEPLRGYMFAVKGENSQNIEFKLDAGGKVTEFSMSRAGSSTVFKRSQ